MVHMKTPRTVSPAGARTPKKGSKSMESLAAEADTTGAVRHKEADAQNPQRWMDELLLMLHVRCLAWDTQWGKSAFGSRQAAYIENGAHWVAYYSQRLNDPRNYHVGDAA